MSRAKGPQEIPHDFPPELGPTWNEVLDKSVEKHFSGFGVRATTEISKTGRWVTRVHTKKGTLTPALYNQVNAFIAGFMACEKSY